MNTQVYECPGCGDRKMVEYSEEVNVKPVVWCSCAGFKIMEGQ